MDQSSRGEAGAAERAARICEEMRDHLLSEDHARLNRELGFDASASAIQALALDGAAARIRAEVGGEGADRVDEQEEPYEWLPEDAGERKSFERFRGTATVASAVGSLLRACYAAAPEQGSHRKQLAVWSNALVREGAARQESDPLASAVEEWKERARRRPQELAPQIRLHPTQSGKWAIETDRSAARFVTTADLPAALRELAQEVKGR